MDDCEEGECSWCGDVRVIYSDNGRCEQCDSDVTWCAICKSDQHCDSPCRHVFKDRYGAWAGAGIGHATEDVKAAFFNLLDRMPYGFPGDLRFAIRSGRFHTWLVAPLIGGGGMLSLYGMPDRDGRWMWREYGDRMIELGEHDDAGTMADGYHWLASLYDRKTRRANNQTLAMLSEWTNRFRAVA